MKKANALIHESSPYLLQHAYNPVNWYPWGEAAFALAAKNDLPILVSIGYSACHWCHVMERESFEDEHTAAFMNAHFINIKIDREERPDLDHVYMDAVQALTGSGGWPLHVFLTPDRLPFYGGTYFPPKPLHNRPSWMDVLYSMSEYWKNKKAEVQEQARELLKHLQQSNTFSFNSRIKKDAPGHAFYQEQYCHTLADSILKNADWENGGFGRAPKFLQTFSLQYLLQFAALTGNETYNAHALQSLQQMLNGGIYDQLGAGIARYSTDNYWLVPHFEKMLYDNALLVLVLCDAYQITGELLYKQAIVATLDFIIGEWKSKDGGYYTALDADSEGHEGKYYVWQKEEVDALLGSDAAMFCSYYNITVKGNWDGTNILHIKTPAATVAQQFHLTESEFLVKMEACRKLLLQHRAKRIAPALDNKILLSNNALLLKAFCNAYAALQQDIYLQEAIALCNFIQQNMTADNGTLLHTLKGRNNHLPAFLDGYTYYIDALIALQEVTGELRYLKLAQHYQQLQDDLFSDEDYCFYYFSNCHQDDVPVRKKELYDGVSPSGNAKACSNLFYLAGVFDCQPWRQRAQRMLENIFPAIEKYTGSFACWAAIYLQQCMGIHQIVIRGAQQQMVLPYLLKAFIPNKIFIWGNDRQAHEIPLLRDKPGGDKLTIYICKGEHCLAPIDSIQELIPIIKKLNLKP